MKEVIMPKGIPRDKSVEQKILHRLKIARGQLDSVIEMAKNGKYCIDIIHQSIAVQAALKGTDQIIMKNHMETCVAEEIKKGNAREVIDEVMKVIERS
jgi:CsoR family transcriptional regulator, copper-sensing transcriptional repressor